MTAVPTGPTVESIASLVQSRRLIVACGSGGVGKTTTSAVLGIAGALAGRRTLVLTIDPAKRLADSLGIGHLDDTERQVPPERLRDENGTPARGELWAMMLDCKNTFDALIERVAPDPAARQRIFANRLYQLMSSRLAGSQEYMAMERLWYLFQQGRYDLIVLDTPPTKNALDFLDAPNKLAQLFDESVMRWFIARKSERGSFLGFNWLSAGSSIVYKLLGAIVGQRFVDDTVDFFTSFSDVYRGFRERALSVQALLKSPEAVFVLVTGPDRAHLETARFFFRKLSEHGLAVGAVVVNRAYHDYAEIPLQPNAARMLLHEEDFAALATEEPGVADRLAQTLTDKLAEAHRFNGRVLEELRRWAAPLGAAERLYRVPILARDVNEIEDLLRIRPYLVAPSV